MAKLETDLIFTEADQAIYTKVIDAMFQMEGEEIFKTVIPRMGGFHIILCMLRIILSLFKNCMIIQLLSATGFGGMGTIKKYFSGADVRGS